MAFIDEAYIKLAAGSGGAGCCSFRKEKFIERGGPDGGDGGKGGSVFLVARSDISTLLDVKLARHYKAQNGTRGHGSNKHGRSGEDLYVDVPLGTVVTERETGRLIVDMVNPDEPFCILEGGAGGFGNVHFKSSTNRAPRKTTPGEEGEVCEVKFELKMIADIGLVGFPNAGKSSIIRMLTQSKSKVGDYPFTTLSPHLGVLRFDHTHSCVIADIPGLVEGASGGVGLGLSFLKHVSRCAVLTFVIDVSDGVDVACKSYLTLERELSTYDDNLQHKKRCIVLNKTDVLHEDQKKTIKGDFRAGIVASAGHELIDFQDVPLLATCALTHDGKDILVESLKSLFLREQD